MKSKLVNNILLLVTALIWGAAFVAQSKGLEYVGSFWLNTFRMLLAGVVLIPVALFIEKRRTFPSEEEQKKSKRLAIVAGIACGAVLFAAASLQNFGIVDAGAGKSGFLTSIYILIVPIISMVLHEKVKLNVWISTLIALVGMYFLCVKDGSFQLATSDILLVLCAFFFSVQIVIIGRYSKHINGVMLSCVQSFVCGALSLIFALCLETITIDALISALWPIIYLAVFSSGVAYTLQIIAQKNTNATVASLIMSLEAVFSLILGILMLGEKFTAPEMVGCALIFIGVILSQFSFTKKKETDLIENA